MAFNGAVVANGHAAILPPEPHRLPRFFHAKKIALITLALLDIVKSFWYLHEMKQLHETIGAATLAMLVLNLVLLFGLLVNSLYLSLIYLAVNLLATAYGLVHLPSSPLGWANELHFLLVDILLVAFLLDIGSLARQNRRRHSLLPVDIFEFNSPARR